MPIQLRNLISNAGSNQNDKRKTVHNSSGYQRNIFYLHWGFTLLSHGHRVYRDEFNLLIN
jgi:hypothetical protein